MVGSIGSNEVNKLQSFVASNAFKAAKTKTDNNTQETTESLDVREDRELKSDITIQSKLANFNEHSMDEIKQVATQRGEEITNEDIKYGLMYGRSVLVDYSA